MPYFPDHPFASAGDFANAYFSEIQNAHQSVDRMAISAACAMVSDTVGSDASIFSCGNGGSAAISNHLLCDCLKGVQAGTAIRPRVHTLSSAVELITAIVNDVGPDEMFSLPLQSLGRSGDLLIAISSSGESRNIVRALEVAKSVGMRTIAMTGFEGGAAAQLADVSLYVKASNYGVVEDVHQSLMHILAQHLRQTNLSDLSDLGRVKF